MRIPAPGLFRVVLLPMGRNAGAAVAKALVGIGINATDFIEVQPISFCQSPRHLLRVILGEQAGAFGLAVLGG